MEFLEFCEHFSTEKLIPWQKELAKRIDELGSKPCRITVFMTPRRSRISKSLLEEYESILQTDSTFSGEFLFSLKKE